MSWNVHNIDAAMSILTPLNTRMHICMEECRDTTNAYLFGFVIDCRQNPHLMVI